MYRSNGRYSILVHSATAARVQYTIVVGDTAMATTLVDGQPRTVEAAVPAGQWRYYRGVAASNAAQDLQFGVTAMSGAVTMYVSRSNKAPSATNYTYMATTSSGFTVGSKAVSVVIPRAQIVPGYYYIAVHVEGTVASTFTVTMTTSSLVLAVGGAGGGGGGGGGAGQATAQQATCATGARYFRMNLPTTRLPAQLNDLTFLVAPADWDSAMYSGRFYLYVSRADQYPTQATAMWSSGALTLNQEWVIARDNWELVACVAEGNRLGTGCNLYVAVSCLPPSSTTSFLLTVNNGIALEPLVDGVPRHATLAVVSTQANANSRRSYVSYVNEAHGLWLMAETCRGHTQLFVSRTATAPNTNNAQYRLDQDDGGRGAAGGDQRADHQHPVLLVGVGHHQQHAVPHVVGAAQGRHLAQGAAARAGRPPADRHQGRRARQRPPSSAPPCPRATRAWSTTSATRCATRCTTPTPTTRGRCRASAG